MLDQADNEHIKEEDRIMKVIVNKMYGDMGYMCNILPQLAVTRCDRDFVIGFSWLFWKLCLCSTSER
jgi:hypothetical protein